MLYPSINEIRKKADSRYTIVILAAKRARDIIDGKPILTDADTDKPVSIAANAICLMKMEIWINQYFHLFHLSVPDMCRRSD